MGLPEEAEALGPIPAQAVATRSRGGGAPARNPSTASGAAPAPGNGGGARRLTPSRPEPRRLATNPAAEARKVAADAQTLHALKSAIEAFTLCPLRQAARNTVVCDGAMDAPILLIGEAPGAEEDANGLPFVGRSGKLLDRMLATIGISRARNILISNLVYWRPPGNRDPTPEELAICAPFVHRMIELKRPKLLLTAGKFATHAMLRTDEGIMRLRGRRTRYQQEGMEHVPCIPLLHPSYLLRRPQDKAKAWEDMLTIAAVCDELGIAREGGL
jgi:DNA polymerase